MVDVIPGILEKETDQIAHKVSLVAPHVSWVQIDLSDGTLTPGTTSMDIPGIARIISEHPKLSFEAHLMVAKPEKYLKTLSDAGFKRIIAHVECVDPRLFLDDAEYESVEVGLALDGATELDQIEPFLNEIDFILIMTIEAGASGQPFLPETVEKIRIIRENMPDLPVEVDGGINDVTAKVVKDAGATRLSATSFIFDYPEGVDKAVAALKNA